MDDPQEPSAGFYYKARQGDCVESISRHFGFLWETIWNHAANQELNALRKDPNVLLPGDVVFIPNKRLREESGQTDRRHRFRLKAAPSKLVLVMMDQGRPRAKQPYTLVVDGCIWSGVSGQDGRIEHAIPAASKGGSLTFGPPDAQERYEFRLGHVDPISELSGVQARLKNLGLACPQDGQPGEETTRAIAEFQEKYRLPVTGELDEATRNKLKETYGC